MISEKHNGQDLYRIENFDQIEPFLMSVTSSEDYWMYISSTGCLTAGRRNAETCLFPFDTVNILHTNAHITGPVTIIRIEDANTETHLWEPFSQSNPKFQIQRNLYKNCIGNTIIFEEINLSLDLTFRYQWNISKGLGFVKKATIINNGKENRNLNIIDGLQNIMPSGIELNTQQTMSNLSNAYRHSEILSPTKCAIFSLTSLLMDRPEPGESLRANTVWCSTNVRYKTSLCSNQLIRFKNQLDFEEVHLLTGKPGSFLVNISECIEPKSEISWDIISDINRTQVEIANLIHQIEHDNELSCKIRNGIKKESLNLEKYIGSADGFHGTKELINDMHHTANVLFNIMRGGIPFNNYNIDKSDFLSFIKLRNKHVFDIYEDFLNEVSDSDKIIDIIKKAEDIGDPSLIRLCYNYLPITFGRRHGDPSRPWNRFDIKVRDKFDKQLLYYEGNWRDIFQNWEALSISYPLTLRSMLSNFVNNCTADGFNPYRITRDGIDWEILEPDNGWSYIGYWNDHQIIYLLKFMEHLSKINSNILTDFLDEDIFSYANVPYKIKDFESLVENPKQTIDFDFEKNAKINYLVEALGTDAKLILTDSNQVYHVNLCEKLLVLILAKVSNFIPGGGIWLNTQRPEWNDANNALVGYGLSMVTVYYLRRFLEFFKQLLSQLNKDSIILSNEVCYWFEGIQSALYNHKKLIDKNIIDPENRMSLINDLGTTYSEYRKQLYDDGFSGKRAIDVKSMISFIDLSLQYFDHTITINTDENELYHAYNIINFKDNNTRAEISNLYEMLEGQVAVLSSGSLSSQESIKLLENLYASEMYRSDQNTFMLYPIKKLNRFMEKNIIPEALVLKNSLMGKMLEQGNTSIVNVDAQGNYRFNADFKNITNLKGSLHNLHSDGSLGMITKKDESKILDIFETVFKHKSFTGRSSNIFGYEGIGSIYWHMVSKLLLAVQEIFFNSVALGEDKQTIQTLGEYYYKVRGGLSADKSAEEYGAFPFDPYSHTPYNSGAKQPGMTGQVKEEIITRMGELGCIVEDGCLTFQPTLMRKTEFLTEAREFTYFNISKEKSHMAIQKDELAYTYCQVPIVYHLSDKDWLINIYYTDGKVENIKGNKITKAVSQLIFSRNNLIKEIRVECPASSLLF